MQASTPKAWPDGRSHHRTFLFSASCVTSRTSNGIGFRQEMADADVPDRYGDAEFDGAGPDPALVEEAWNAWREEVAFSEQLAADTDDLGARRQRRGVPLREVLIHMIEEYARHNGHADLLRERIDGPSASSSTHCRTRFDPLRWTRRRASCLSPPRAAASESSVSKCRYTGDLPGPEREHRSTRRGSSRAPVVGC